MGYYNAKKFDARHSIGYLVRRASSIMTAHVEALFRSTELTLLQYIILMNLRDGLAMTCTDLSKTMSYDSGTVTRVVDQLVQKGMVKRQRSDRDKRIVKLFVTPSGKSAVESVLPRVVQKYNTWLEDFTKEEADMLVQLMTKLNNKVCDKSTGKKG